MGAPRNGARATFSLLPSPLRDLAAEDIDTTIVIICKATTMVIDDSVVVLATTMVIDDSVVVFSSLREPDPRARGRDAVAWLDLNLSAT